MTSVRLFHILTVISAFVITLALIPFIKIIAQRLGFVSKIDFRRRELVPRPLLGGIALFIGAIAANAIFGWIPWSYVVPAMGLIVLGAVDDKLQINAKLKLSCEIAVVVVWLLMTPPESLLLARLSVPIPLAILLHAFWVIGMINAFNMIDGMDGLSSGMAVLGFFFLGWFMPGDQRWFAWSLGAACAAHLVYNRPPAVIFLGDSGSLVLGFLLSALGSTLQTKIIHPTSVLVPLFILAHPEMDAILAMARRKIAGTPIFQGDKDHLHHKLRRVGLGPYASLGVTYFATIYCGLTAVLLDSIHDRPVMWLAMLLCILGISSLIAGLYYAEHRLATQVSFVNTSLLRSHLHLTGEPNLPERDYSAVVFDLLPYYKELQERGVADVNAFVEEFSDWVNRTFAGSQIISPGAYSVIVIAPGTTQDAESVVNDFKTIVAKHGVLKNNVGKPWGLHLFVEPKDTRSFERKFGALLRSPVIESGKAA